MIGLYNKKHYTKFEATVTRNPSRRFRYTLDIEKEEEDEKLKRIIRSNSESIRASILNGQGQSGSKRGVSSGKGYGVGVEQLAQMIRDQNFSSLEEFGGVTGLADLLETNLEMGIRGDDGDIMCRQNEFGSNNYPQKKGKTFWMYLWEAWQDSTLIMLMVAAALSLGLGLKSQGSKGWYDGASIGIAVLLIILITAISDYRQSLRFQDMNEEKRNIKLEVIRGGRRVEVSIYDIVVGDVVPLKIGDQVPADGILIAGHSLAIDESSMTGESKTVQKDQTVPFLMSGCKVADGFGTMVVTGVGINTEWGLIMATISEDTGEETPLQVRLNGVASFMGFVGFAIALTVLVVLLARYFTGHTKNPEGNIEFVHGKTSTSQILDDLVNIVTAAVTILVIAVPEGLPLAVRRLSACETMGSATTICSDKTGTLTLNQMTVVEAHVGKNKMDTPEDSSQLHAVASSLLLEGITQNTIGSVFVPENDGEIEVSGSPTEKAILCWGTKLGMEFHAIRSNSRILHVSPFNSEKKRGGIALQLADAQVHLHWKGAAEVILASCSHYLDADGAFQSLEEEDKEYFGQLINDMAARSLRCVAFAYRSYENEMLPADEKQLKKWILPEDDLVLLAVVGIKDPCRPGVKEAVKICSDAGIKVRMVTGDNLHTAKAIALECGILGSDEEAMEPYVVEGRAFRALSETEREQVAKKIQVMGRSSPRDKLLLVQALRKGGDVVAVTGDGTNDAPALHEADIGLSMGIQGTEVAKESSDIIILDDNFASVVKVVRWGRSVFANVQKFIQFQLTINVAAILINVVAAFSTGSVPLNTVQLLWINLIQDTLAALALATEPPTDHPMHRPPVGRREPLVSNVMWINILVQSFYQVTVLLVLNFGGTSILHLTHESRDHATKVKNTVIFNSFVLCQVFNEFNSRKTDELNVFRGVMKNYLFLGVIGLTLIFQIIAIEFLGKFFSTVRLDWDLWLVSIGIGIVSLPLAVLGRLLPVPKRPFAKYFTKRLW
ncbi:Cation-transporting P-type ATPase, C-terminal [Dillenia turbinata]|uniref:Calcium-transporting ATPase n=1 Tax=Dillenia turbinata TaxID=194707 RepID=A0AAN8UPR5_9MAGN